MAAWQIRALRQVDIQQPLEKEALCGADRLTTGKLALFRHFHMAVVALSSRRSFRYSLIATAAPRDILGFYSLVQPHLPTPSALLLSKLSIQNYPSAFYLYTSYALIWHQTSVGVNWGNESLLVSSLVL